MANKYELYLNNELRVLFNERFLKLSERAKTVLRSNGIARWTKFKAVIRNESFSFLRLRQCGEKTSLELSNLSNEIKEKEKELYVLLNKKKEADLYETLHRYSDNIHKSKIYDFNLSARAHNCLRKANIHTIDDLINFNKSQGLLSIKNLGEKTLNELTELITAYNSSSEIVGHNDIQTINLTLSRDELLKNDDTIPCESNFTSYFKTKYGYLPMLYLVKKHLDTYKDKEIKALYDKYGIEKWDSLNDLKRGSVKYLYDSVELKLVNDPIIQSLCAHKDWGYYGIYHLFVDYWFYWYVEGSFISKDMVDREEITLNEYLLKQKENSLITLIQIKPRTRVNELLILNLFGLKCLWVNYSKKSVSSRQIHSFNDDIKQLIVNKKYIEFNYNKVFKEVVRLKNIRTSTNISIPINTYFINNEDYWKRKVSLNEKERFDMYKILSELIKHLYGVTTNEGVIIIKANRVDYADELFGILKDNGKRLSIDDMLDKLNVICINKGHQCVYKDTSQIRRFLTNDPRFVPYGKSAYWGLKEWGEVVGSIREIAIETIKKSDEPVRIQDITKIVLDSRPDSNERSVSAIIWQMVINEEVVLFFDNYIGDPNKTYPDAYISMPRKFNDWIISFKDFVIKNNRFPYANKNSYEGYLYRWYHKAIDFVGLSSDEILLIDSLGKQLVDYPHNAFEYRFLQKCNIYKSFVDQHLRIITKNDDVRLFQWFNNNIKNYDTYNDNRKKYFLTLIQYLTIKLEFNNEV